MPGFLLSKKLDYAKARSKSDMDLEPIYNPNLNPIYTKPKHLKPKDIPQQKRSYTTTLEDIHKKLETLEKKVEHLIQLMEEKN